MNVVVLDYFHNKFVSTAVVIQHIQQLRRSAYIKSCINVGTYNIHNNWKVSINHTFSIFCLCVNITRKKYPSRYSEHVNEKW